MAKTAKGKAAAKQPAAVTWTREPAEHDYPSAASYLRLIAGPELVEVVTALLSQAPTVQQHAKDILRAAGLTLLGPDDAESLRTWRRSRPERHCHRSC